MRKARIRLGLTLAQLANRCTERGVPLSEGWVSRIERGHASGSPEVRVALAEVLGLDPYHDFEMRRDEPAGSPPSNVGVHGVRGEERAVQTDVPELPDTRVERSA